MRAVVLYEHGGLEKLIYESDYRAPSPGIGDVLVRMRACALNYHDVFTRKGMPGIKVPLPLIAGNDVAGEVAAGGAPGAGVGLGGVGVGEPPPPGNGGFFCGTHGWGLPPVVGRRAHMFVARVPQA